MSRIWLHILLYDLSELETWQRRPGSESWDDALWPTVEATQEAFLATFQSTSYHSVPTYPDGDDAQIPAETLA